MINLKQILISLLLLSIIISLTSCNILKPKNKISEYRKQIVRMHPKLEAFMNS